jgi:hypothetical protein
VDHVQPQSMVDHGGAGGALTEDGAAVKRPGDGGKVAAKTARGGGELQHERGGRRAVWGAVR